MTSREIIAEGMDIFSGNPDMMTMQNFWSCYVRLLLPMKNRGRLDADPNSFQAGFGGLTSNRGPQ